MDASPNELWFRGDLDDFYCNSKDKTLHQTNNSGKNICTQLHLMTDLALNYRRYENLHEVRHNEYIDKKAIRRL